jgi:hypothetical protein
LSAATREEGGDFWPLGFSDLLQFGAGLKDVVLYPAVPLHEWVLFGERYMQFDSRLRGLNGEDLTQRPLTERPSRPRAVSANACGGRPLHFPGPLPMTGGWTNHRVSASRRSFLRASRQGGCPQGEVVSTFRLRLA